MPLEFTPEEIKRIEDSIRREFAEFQEKRRQFDEIVKDQRQTGTYFDDLNRKVLEARKVVTELNADFQKFYLTVKMMEDPSLLRSFRDNVRGLRSELMQMFVAMEEGGRDEKLVKIGKGFLLHLTRAWDEFLRVAGPFGELIRGLEALFPNKLSFSLISLLVAGRVLQSEVDVIGKRVLLTFESVTTGAMKLSSTLGSTLYDISKAWHISTNEVMSIASGWIKVFGKAILDSSQSIEEFFNSWVQKGKYWSQATGLSVEGIQSFFSAIVSGLGRTASSIYQAEGAFAIMAATAKGTRFTVQEFMDMVRGAQSELGLFGVTADNVNAIIRRMYDIFTGIGVAIPGGLEALRGFIQSYMRFEAQLARQPGWLMFLTGRLDQPAGDIGTLWNRLVEASQQYFAGGAGGLVLSYIDRMMSMMQGRNISEMRGAIGFTLMQQMGLPASIASVLDKFIDIVGTLTRRGIPLDRDVLQYLKTGDPALLEKISGGNKEIMKAFEELRSVSSKFSQDTTSLLTKLADLADQFVKRIFANFTSVLMDLLVMIIGLIAKIIPGVRPEVRALFEAGWGAFKLDVRQLGQAFSGFFDITGEVLKDLVGKTLMDQWEKVIQEIKRKEEQEEREIERYREIHRRRFVPYGRGMDFDARERFFNQRFLPQEVPQVVPREPASINRSDLNVSVYPEIGMQGSNLVFSFSLPLRVALGFGGNVGLGPLR